MTERAAILVECHTCSRLPASCSLDWMIAQQGQFPPEPLTAETVAYHRDRDHDVRQILEQEADHD